ncbi:hypothetical protein GSI_04722 [Ganoderma sinense ZZ0214-1]|uniref:BTB domain-containing protein n=1 Tax=Ganoderma sinense ZZ0214-1 TaxID=1077348 RepID=A0A2G8SHN5_9APHY|nr:hypothetical protein GSI_04722 [Ganoderma sinense ZZ0214-1]
MSSESAPSRKRPRVEDGDRERPSNRRKSDPRKDDDVWLSDGSIVVVAADNVAFRVHKSTLSLRSEIFRDLFSLPNADEATAETMDGCPVVRVSDTSSDIRHLLLVLCCGKNYYHDGDALIAVPFETLASLVRMAHKYAVQDVLDHALSRLKKFYTNDLAAWQDPDARARYVAAKDQHALTVVQLARLTNTPPLLPTAFLLCTKLLATLARMKQGVPVALGVSSLPVPDQLTIISAREYLLHMCAERTLHLLAGAPCTACTTLAVCSLTREAPLSSIRDGHAFPAPPLFRRDVLQPMAATLWGDRWHMFCDNCREALTEADGKESKWVWRNLPRIFGVKLDRESWPSLPADHAT